METSPYLLAIQALPGTTPGEKYRHLHSIAIQIIQDEHKKNEFLESKFTAHIQPALLPFLRILVGKKLKLKEAVIEALKSDDVTIVEQALKAKWFFNADNKHIRVDYFLDHIIPFVSLRTRHRLFKILTRCLARSPQKADDFFISLVDLYGLDETLPFMVSCSENFILETVFKRRIVLSHKILRTLYLKYPRLVIRYLQLGNEKSEKNLKDKVIHKIDITKYFKLLPMIAKHHTQEFVEIYESLSTWYMTGEIKIGSTRAKYMLTHSADLMIQKAELVFKTMPLKVIVGKLSGDQFETIFGNLFPKDVEELSPYDMIYHLRYYPNEKKFLLLQEKYKLAYGTDILDKPDIHQTTELFRILPSQIKEEFGRKVLELHRGTAEYYEFADHLPPSEAIPMMKKRIAACGSAQKVSCIQTMITSCSYHDSKEHLLEVLEYFHDQYKNGPAEVFFRVVQKLMQQFGIDELDKSCWQILMDFTQKFYFKGDLYNTEDYFYWGLFHGGLLFFVKECQKNSEDEEMKLSLDKFVEMILNCYLEHDMKVDLLPSHEYPAELKRYCLQKYLVTVPLLYPENHEVWCKFGNKLTIVSYLVKAIDDYDFKELCRGSIKKYKSGNVVEGKSTLRVRDYPWLTKFAHDLLMEGESFTDSEEQRKYESLTKSLKRHDFQLYLNFVGEKIDFSCSLKRCRDKNFNSWKSFFNVCREKLQSNNQKSVKKFVKATKWYQNLPMKFIEKCKLEIEEPGTIQIIALLLEGEEFDKIVQAYIPEDKKINFSDNNAKTKYEFISTLIKSMNYVNPPLSFETMFAYCQGDYLSLANNILISSATERIPVDRVVTFAKQLMDKSVPIKKLGIRLVCRVSSYAESSQFLERLLNSETNHSVRAMMMKIIRNMFKQAPNIHTWQLMKICIDRLTISEEQMIFKMVKEVDEVDKDFVSHYIRELLKKIEELEDHVKSKFLEALIDKLINTPVVNFISEDVLIHITKNQFFNCDQRFLLTAYLLSDSNKFDERLKTIIDILHEHFKKYNEPHPKHPRQYPMNLQLRQFFSSIVSHVLCAKKTDMTRKLIVACLDLLSKTLKLHDDHLLFMKLYIVKDYTESSTPQEFGVKCANTALRLAEYFNSEMILTDIGEFVERMLCNGYVYAGNGLVLRMDVIEGLSRVDDRFAALIGTKLLTYHDANKYDDRYDEFFKRWSVVKDPMVLAVVNSFRNQTHNN